jgi:acetyl-CoA carboxylase carboxyltransferase component
MRKGATMAVASSRVTSLAIGQDVDPETLGGWKLHTATTGLVDIAVDSDEEALDAIRRFLSYLPSHAGEAAPRVAPETGAEPVGDVLEILPESRSQVYDMRKIVEAIVDAGSLFELKSRFGKSIVTTLARIDGAPVGVIANNPKFKGGAIDVDACLKVTSFLVLCDSFNLPLIFLVDQPGFLIGMEGEARGAPGRIMNWINALSQVTVPKFSIVVRKSYGQAYLNMGGGRNSDEVACWPTADLGFMEPSLAVNVLHGLRRDDDPQRFDALVTEVARDTSAWSLAALYEAQTVIDPRDTRTWLRRMLTYYRGGARALSERLLSNWPTHY